LHVGEEGNQRVRAHCYDRRNIQHDQRSPLFRIESKFCGVHGRIGKIFLAFRRIMRETVQRQRARARPSSRLRFRA